MSGIPLQIKSVLYYAITQDLYLPLECRPVRPQRLGRSRQHYSLDQPRASPPGAPFLPSYFVAVHPSGREHGPPSNPPWCVPAPIPAQIPPRRRTHERSACQRSSWSPSALVKHGNPRRCRADHSQPRSSATESVPAGRASRPPGYRRGAGNPRHHGEPDALLSRRWLRQ